MFNSITALLLGFLLDLVFGDPHWMPHPVRLIGWLIAKGEALLRPRFPRTPEGEKTAGTVLALCVILLSGGGVWLLLRVAGMIHPLLSFAITVLLSYQILATKALKSESMKVYDKLQEQDLPGARYAVSMIVGRDTENLTASEVAKAAVETVAENTSDGVIAPLLYLVLGGPVLAMSYKAVNTMDSMIGYKNDKYLYFGRFAAKLDDVVNYIPARLSAWFMIAASGLVGLDSKGAARIYRRDRYNHASPNSAHTEAVCAGALGVQLAGDAWYFGKRKEKPTIGDDLRPIENEDIARSNRLLYATAILALLVMNAVKAVILMLF